MILDVELKIGQFGILVQEVTTSYLEENTNKRTLVI